MRAFIAIDLPHPVGAALAEVQASFQGLCPDAHWARPEGIHLTLKFLGEISEAQILQVTGALTQTAAFEPFSVEATGLGFFPNSRRPRVFWAGVSAPPALAELASRIESQMEKIGFARESRNYSPHLTLARFKVPRPQARLVSAVTEAGTPSFGQFEVSEFFLFESKLSPQGAEYRKVMQIKNSGQWLPSNPA